jgi:type I restriction enzyme, R subunit
MDLFHQIRIAGNQATHGNAGNHNQALTTLKIAPQLAIWFHKSFGKRPDFKAGPFVPPPEPEDATTSLRKELEDLRSQLAEHQSAAELARSEAETATRAAKVPKIARDGKRRSEPLGSNSPRKLRTPNLLLRNSWRRFRQRRRRRRLGKKPIR